MKKNMILIASLCVIFTQAMEQENQWSIKAYDTTINVNKGDFLDTYADGQKKVDFIVVGKNGQETLGFCTINGSEIPVGCCWNAELVGFVTKKENSNYKHLNSIQRDGKSVSIKKFPMQQDCNVCIKIEEPFVTKNEKENTYRYVYRIGNWREDNNGRIVVTSIGGGLAQYPVSLALEHLEVCYKNALAYVAKKNDQKMAKSIALPPLGTDSIYTAFLKDKAASVAVKAILEYIKNNPGAYDLIELFVEEDFEFVLYKDLLKKSLIIV